MKKEIESLQSTLDKERKCENEFKLEEFNPIQTSKTFASAGMADVERLLEVHVLHILTIIYVQIIHLTLVMFCRKTLDCARLLKDCKFRVNHLTAPHR